MIYDKYLKFTKKLSVILFFIKIILSRSSLSYAQNNQFDSLQKTLTDYGFTIKLEIPPYQTQQGIRPYGVLSSQTKTIWINPVVFELGNAQATLIHEATHAAQLCAGEGEFKLINLTIKPPKITHPYFLRYHNYQREIEAEAYTVQVQPNSLELVNQLLNKYCSPN